jgi:hypothetical protein
MINEMKKIGIILTEDSFNKLNLEQEVDLLAI